MREGSTTDDPATELARALTMRKPLSTVETLKIAVGRKRRQRKE